MDRDMADAPVLEYQAQFSEAPNWAQLWNTEWGDITMTSNRLIMTQLQPATHYRVRVRAKNVLGYGDYCEAFEVLR